MTEETPNAFERLLGAMPESEQAIPRLDFRDVPTVLVDGATAFAKAGDVYRVMFSELTFDPDPASSVPRWRPAVALAIPRSALPSVIEYLQGVLGADNVG